jgi:hypothetical protein
MAAHYWQCGGRRRWRSWQVNDCVSPVDAVHELGEEALVVVDDAGEPLQQVVALMRTQLLHVHLPELALGLGRARGAGRAAVAVGAGQISIAAWGRRPELDCQGPPARARLPWARRPALAGRWGGSQRRGG